MGDSYIDDINQILFENATYADVNKLKHKKHKKKLDFFDSLFRSMGSGYFHRSHKLFVKNRFYKSKEYNRFKSSYADRLKIYQRSKSHDTDTRTEKSEDEISYRPDHTYLTLFRIVAIAFSMECLFCIQEALTVPLLLKLKISEKFYSLVYLLVPLIGFFFQPVVGVLSDRCQSSFGPRRPFILLLSLFSLGGLVSLLVAPEIGEFIQEKTNFHPNMPIIGITIACLGVALLNFSTDSTNNSARALIIDNCNQEDQDSGLSFMSLVSAIGSLFGYMLGAIDWNRTPLRILGNDRIIMSIISSVIVITCLIITLTSIEETPLDFNDDDETDDETSPLLSKSIDYKPFNWERVPDSPRSSIEDEILKKNIQKFEDLCDESEDEPITIGLIYKSVFNMPKELFRLLVCHILGWMSIWSLCLFYTDFIAQVIYHGDPVAAPGSMEFEAYNQGVKMGCWGLVCASIVSAISAVILERYLIDYFSYKTLYFWSNFIYAISIGLVYFQTNIYIIFALSSVFGVLLNIYLVLPYQMISEFHNCNVYRSQSSEGTKRGIGIDCALLSSVYFLAQTLVASFTSLLTSTFGNSVIVLTSSCLAFMSCLWISLFLIFPEEKPDESDSENLSITLTI